MEELADVAAYIAQHCASFDPLLRLVVMALKSPRHDANEVWRTVQERISDPTHLGPVQHLLQSVQGSTGAGMTSPAPTHTWVARQLESLYVDTILPAVLSSGPPALRQIPVVQQGVAHLRQPIASSLRPDLTLVSYDGVEVPCHEWVLQARWRWFSETLSEHPELITKGPRGRVINFNTDYRIMGGHALHALVHFLYTRHTTWLANAPDAQLQIIERAYAFKFLDLGTKEPYPEYAQLVNVCKPALSAPPVMATALDRYSVTLDIGTPQQHSAMVVFLCQHLFDIPKDMQSMNAMQQRLGARKLASLLIEVVGGNLPAAKLDV